MLILIIITLLVYGITFIQEIIPTTSEHTNTHTTAYAINRQPNYIPTINARRASLSDLFDQRAIISGTLQIELVEPQSAAPGVMRHFYVNHFAPGEAIELALHTPRGGAKLDLQVRATERGEVWLELPASDLTTGSHSLVLRGAKSRHEVVIPFEVRE